MSTKNAKRIPSFQTKTACEYMSELGLDDDLEEDIQQEIETAKVAWSAIVSTANGNMTADGALILEERIRGNGSVNMNDGYDDDDDDDDDDSGESEGALCQLVTRLGTTYSEDEHGATIATKWTTVDPTNVTTDKST